MFEELVGKRIGVNMLFASHSPDCATPVLYHGILLSTTDGFLKVKVSSANFNWDSGMMPGFTTKQRQKDNIMYFNVNSISSITVEE